MRKTLILAAVMAAIAMPAMATECTVIFNGKKLIIDGGSENPGIICQHGGDCVPLTAVKFLTACTIFNSPTMDGAPYYGWRRAVK